MTRATPHWNKAEEEKAKAAKLSDEAKQLSAEIDNLRATKSADAEDKRKKLIALRDDVLAGARAADQRAKEEKAAGDAIYWPIYNLDRKNPHGKEDFEHRPPEQLADDILAKEHKIMEIMKEIRSLLNSRD